MGQDGPPDETPDRKSPTARLVMQDMRYLLLAAVLVVLVFLGNMMWVAFFGGRSLF